MPIVREYQLPQEIIAQGAFTGFSAIAAAEQRRILEVQAEERRQLEL